MYLQGFKAKHILGNKIIHEQTLFRLVFNQHISVKLVKKESKRGTASALHHAKIYLSETNSDWKCAYSIKFYKRLTQASRINGSLILLSLFFYIASRSEDNSVRWARSSNSTSVEISRKSTFRDRESLNIQWSHCRCTCC